jgi:hypothetical protein
VALVNDDVLFDHKLIEVARAATPRIDEYMMLTASAALRLILLDEQPLLHKVNRTRRMDIRFEVCSETTPVVKVVLEDRPEFWALLDWISPVYAPGCITLSLDRERFLAKRAAIVQGHDVSVKDVILQIAHVAGGVHAGAARTDIEKALQEQSELMAIGGIPAVERMIKGIAAVVADALIPLGERIRAERGITPPGPGKAR